MFYKRFSSRLFQMDAEEAHDKVSRGLHVLGDIPLLPALMRRFCTVHSEWLPQKLFGMTFDNPVGLAAGMDKTGEALLGWQCFGFGFLEVGGFTRLAQSGNDKPRLFRLLKDRAIINRMGFNNPGATCASVTLADIRPRLRVPLFVNIGKSRDVPLSDAPADYAQTLDILYPHGDIFVVNVSSPNTLNLRKLQGKAFLKDILRAVREKSARHPHAPGKDLKPVLVKLAPDLTAEELNEALEAVVEEGASGIIAANTTISREGLIEPIDEAGGLSGPPLFRRMVAMVRHIHTRLPALPIIAVGGIRGADTAYQTLLAGASLAQLYTGLVYEGPGLVEKINRGLAARLMLVNQMLSSLHPQVKRG